MAVDGRLMSRAKNALAEKRRERDVQLERRSREAYAVSPRIEEIDAQIRAAMSELAGAIFDTGSALRVGEIQQRHRELQSERRGLLVNAGFAADYLDDAYMCPVCKDTGYVKSGMCDCLKEIYREEKRKALSSLLKLGCETFDSFDMTYYSDAPSPETGVSPRQHMEIVYETCAGYAKNFSEKSMNLFLNGSPGLGKTFLSASIARVVSDKDYSVVYDTAGAVFSIFEDVKFSKTEHMDEAREDIRRFLECDLLIIDDLGIELTTSQTNEALYELVNTRLITNRKTIINSNLTIDEMRRRYSEQIMSRLEGEYQVLTFYGDDIRKKRKEREV